MESVRSSLPCLAEVTAFHQSPSHPPGSFEPFAWRICQDLALGGKRKICAPGQGLCSLERWQGLSGVCMEK